MKGPHPQSHVTFWCRGHVANKKRYITTFTRPIDPKLSRVVSWDERNPPTKSGDTLILWSCDKEKTLYLHFHKAYGPQTLQSADLGWQDPTHKVTWHSDYVVTWQIYLIRINFGAGKIWRNWRKMAKIAKLNLRQISFFSRCAKLNPWWKNFFSNKKIEICFHTVNLLNRVFSL